MRKIQVLVYVSLMTPALLPGQSPPPATSIELKAGEKIPVANRFISTAIGGIQCDKNGNVYMRPTGGNAPADAAPVLRIAPDGKDSLLYDLSGFSELKEVKNIAALDVAVNAKGNLYQLLVVTDKEGKIFPGIAAFDSDGHPSSFVRVDAHLPTDAHFSPRQIAVFSSGQFLVSGTRFVDAAKGLNGDEAEAKRQRTPFTAIFDVRGGLVQEIQLPGDVKFDATEKPDYNTPLTLPSLAIDLSRVVSADDGNVYLFRQGMQPKVYVISPAGETLRVLSFSPSSGSDREANSTLISVSARRLVFDDFQPGPPGDPRMQLTLHVYDAQAGEKLWDFIPSKDLFGIPACYSGKDFTFLTTTADHHLALLHARP